LFCIPKVFHFKTAKMPYLTTCIYPWKQINDEIFDEKNFGTYFYRPPEKTTIGYKEHLIKIMKVNTLVKQPRFSFYKQNYQVPNNVIS
jgi:hypothetical protein